MLTWCHALLRELHIDLLVLSNLKVCNYNKFKKCNIKQKVTVNYQKTIFREFVHFVLHRVCRFSMQDRGTCSKRHWRRPAGCGEIFYKRRNEEHVYIHLLCLDSSWRSPDSGRVEASRWGRPVCHRLTLISFWYNYNSIMFPFGE